MPFIQDKLTRDPSYNVQLGSQYLAEMLQRFGGSYELALAAYNAGPNRVARWLEAGGDPRTAKIDMLELINARYVPELKKNVPDLKWNKWLSVLGSFMAMRNDVKPFNDLRVRRALNMAINKKEIKD